MRNKSSIGTEPTAGMRVREGREAHGMTRTELARAIEEGGKYAGKYTNFVNLVDQIMWAEKDSRGLTTLALDIIAKAKAEWAAALHKAAKKPTAKAKETKKQPAKKTKPVAKAVVEQVADEIAEVVEQIEAEAVEIVSAA